MIYKRLVLVYNNIIDTTFIKMFLFIKNITTELWTNINGGDVYNNIYNGYYGINRDIISKKINI